MQSTDRVCRSSVLEMKKLRPCNVKWLAHGYKVGNVKAVGFLPGPASPIHCLPEAAPWRTDVSSRWQFCGGDRLPPSLSPLFTLLLASLAFVAGLWRAFDQSSKIMPDANCLGYHLANLAQTFHLVWWILSSVHFVRGFLIFKSDTEFFVGLVPFFSFWRIYWLEQRGLFAKFFFLLWKMSDSCLLLPNQTLESLWLYTCDTIDTICLHIPSDGKLTTSQAHIFHF